MMKKNTPKAMAIFIASDVVRLSCLAEDRYFLEC